MYNNPYYYPYVNPNISMIKPRSNLFKSLTTIKWGDVLNNTQKTLNVINQAIPVYYQIKPIFTNIKSLSRLVNAFNENDETPSKIEAKKENSNNSPTFFIN